ITDNDEEASREKGDFRKSVTDHNKQGRFTEAARKLDQSESEHSDHYDHRITLGVITV
ncbi:hypothetical protein M433DRAFT_160271, partial [Acidomyces richmondensis BFW]